jgi:hypothetical protein
MVLYNCFRCGYNTNQKGHLLKHLSRKNQCSSILEEITNLEILTRNKIDKSIITHKNIYKNIQIPYKNIQNSSKNIYKNIYKKHKVKKCEVNTCEYCKKELSNYYSRWRHQKICKKRLEIIELENKKKENKILEDKNNELIKIIKELSSKSSGNNNNNYNNTNSNNTINNTQNIQINNFDGENVNYITEKLALKLAKNYKNMIGRFVDVLHFNEKHPENHTIRIKDKKSGLGEIREENKWKYLGMDDFLEKINRNLIDKLYELRDMLDEKNVEKFDIWYEDVEKLLNDDKEDKKFKKKIKVASINGSNKIYINKKSKKIDL